MNNLLNDSDSKRVADAAIALIKVLEEKIPRYMHNATEGAVNIALNGVRNDGSGLEKRDLGESIVSKVGWAIESILGSKEFFDSMSAAVERGAREGIENRQC